MKRIYVSITIFAIILVLSIVSNTYIKKTTDSISLQLMAIKSAATDNDFSRAATAYKDLEKYLKDEEKYLGLLLPHESISSFTIDFNGISAYLYPEHIADLNCELDKTIEHANRLDDMFSAVF